MAGGCAARWRRRCSGWPWPQPRSATTMTLGLFLEARCMRLDLWRLYDVCCVLCAWKCAWRSRKDWVEFRASPVVFSFVICDLCLYSRPSCNVRRVGAELAQASRDAKIAWHEGWLEARINTGTMHVVFLRAGARRLCALDDASDESGRMEKRVASHQDKYATK